MKNRFAEYYKPTEAEVQDLWNTATIVFDTNVLLDLYRYDATTRDEFIQIITFYKERLWIPYQVGWEFHRNREVVIRQNAEAYDKLRQDFFTKIDDLLKNAETLADNHPLLNISEIKRRSKTFKTAIEKSLLQQKEAHPVIVDTNDVVLNTITELFEGRTGENFSEEDLCKIYGEGEKRYAHKVPPGYCDKKDKKSCPPQELYGDLILWKQIIKWSAEQSVDIILVSSEEKEDWWNIADDETKSPKVEMLKEFIEQTHRKVLIYSKTAFLENAKKNKNVRISQRTIKEVEKVKTSDTLSDSINILQSLFDDFGNNYDAFNPIKQLRGIDYYTNEHTWFNPMTYNKDKRYHRWGELHQTVDKMGGYDNVIRQLQEVGAMMSSRLREKKEENQLPLTNIIEPNKDSE